ncbi:zinc ion binding protein [Actinidia rufa]|uniref:Zinc ion binding protein n=1 Tax=Actinidia rufa TaxID=165716 RepID=A0A7J0EJN9_9ERIC|nr:zinc ion binding protein [Actinidia rufa]
MFNLNWSIKSRLKDVVYQFRQEFWSTLDCIDQSLWVVDPKQAHHATSHRLINIGNDCQLMLFIDPVDPTSLPEMKNKPLAENLAITLEIQLPGPPDVQKNNQQVECGICYAQCLPIDDELGAKSGSGTDYTCDNGNCSRAFHSLCLGDWLRSITTTRQYGHSMFCLGIVRIVQSRLQ